MHVDRSWLTVMLVIFGTRWFLAGSAPRNGKLIAGGVHFKGSTAIRLLFCFGAPRKRKRVWGDSRERSSSPTQDFWRGQGMPITFTSQPPHCLRSRVMDFILYIAIAIASAVIILVLSHTSLSSDAFARWGGLTIVTTFLFLYFINHSRQFFSKWQFWVLTAILMSVHLTCFAILLTHVVEWKMIWFAGMSFEYPVFIFFRSRLPQLS